MTKRFKTAQSEYVRGRRNGHSTYTEAYDDYCVFSDRAAFFQTYIAGHRDVARKLHTQCVRADGRECEAFYHQGFLDGLQAAADGLPA